MALESNSAALTKGVLYPSTDPFTPAQFKPDGVTLNAPQEGGDNFKSIYWLLLSKFDKIHLIF